MGDVFAGVDLGGTRIKAALATGDGSLVLEQKTETQSHSGPDVVLERIADLVKHMADESGHQVVSVGMGVPGLVDLETGTTKFLPNMPTKWRDVPAGAVLREKLGCPVQLLNDARVATLGELRFGHGKGRDDLTMAFFGMGTGVGGGIAVDGKLRLGPLGAAGELGHQSVIPDGPMCGCGNRGCLETLISGTAIAAEGIRLMRTGLAPTLYDLVEGDAQKVTTKAMAEAVHAGDEIIRDAIHKAAEYLGVAIANVVTVLHPELVVIGGGVAEMGDLLMQPVRDTVKTRVRMFPTDGVEISRSKMGEQAGVMGAVALAIESV
ncbi:MAG: ROK family protein [Planctomycetota bacterium]|jgi:glucokinase